MFFIGLEKVYFQGNWEIFYFWIGKNIYFFEKNNELFWSDNVFFEGVLLSKNFNFSFGIIDYISIKGGYYIIGIFNKFLSDDFYF